MLNMCMLIKYMLIELINVNDIVLAYFVVKRCPDKFGELA